MLIREAPRRLNVGTDPLDARFNNHPQNVYGE
jgi:hypothetical protein